MYPDHPRTNDDSCDCIIEYNRGGFGVKETCKKCWVRRMPTIKKIAKRARLFRELKKRRK